MQLLSLFDSQGSSGSCFAVALYQLCSLISICSEEKYMFPFLVFVCYNDKLSIFPQDHLLCDMYLKLHLAIDQVLEGLQQLSILREGSRNVCSKESFVLFKKSIFRLYISIIWDVWNIFQHVQKGYYCKCYWYVGLFGPPSTIFQLELIYVMYDLTLFACTFYSDGESNPCLIRH